MKKRYDRELTTEELLAQLSILRQELITGEESGESTRSFQDVIIEAKAKLNDVQIYQI